jgi:hypothetical protein
MFIDVIALNNHRFVEPQVELAAVDRQRQRSFKVGAMT